MDQQTTRSMIARCAALALLVCSAVALAQRLPQLPPGSLPPEATASPGAGGGLPKENADDSAMRARIGNIYKLGPLPPGAPEPSPDPHNFEGTWFHEDSLVLYMGSDMYGVALPYTAEGRKVTQRRVDSSHNGKPFLNASAICIPPGQLWQFDLNMPFQVFQTKDRLELMFEEYHGLMTIALDPAKATPSGSYMGRSVGHWEGDTLVVETSGFKEGVWLTTRGTSASKDAKITQRIRKVKTGGNWYLEMTYTLDDPTYYTQPWSFVRRYAWHPDMTLFKDYNCELSTGAPGGVDPSLVPEPGD